MTLGTDTGKLLLNALGGSECDMSPAVDAEWVVGKGGGQLLEGRGGGRAGGLGM